MEISLSAQINNGKSLKVASNKSFCWWFSRRFKSHQRYLCPANYEDKMGENSSILFLISEEMEAMTNVKESQTNKEKFASVENKRTSLAHVQKYELYLTLRTSTLFLLASNFWILFAVPWMSEYQYKWIPVIIRVKICSPSQYATGYFSTSNQTRGSNIYGIHWRRANHLCIYLFDFFFEDENKLNVKWIQIYI